VVALDAYHNNEPQRPGHYRWDERDSGGFSDLATLLRGLGAELTTVPTPVTPKALAKVDCFIVVDPDTPSEAPKPNYIQPQEVDALVKWVSKGGRLVLFGNNRGNAEFTHLNQLAGRFGIQFVDDTLRVGNGPAPGRLTLRTTTAVLGPELQFYAVDVAPLKVSAKKAEILLQCDGTPVMVLVPFGRGKVLALGDPWLYNEYIHTKDNERIGRNVFQHLLRRRN